MNTTFTFEAEPFAGYSGNSHNLEAEFGEEMGSLDSNDEFEYETQTNCKKDWCDSDYVRWVQQSLNRILGLHLKEDGNLENSTRSAIRSFQTKHRLKVDASPGPATAKALVAAGATSPPEVKQLPCGPTSTNELVTLLNKYRGDIPINFLLGWIKVESGGRIDSLTNLCERGYFQVHPEEAKDYGIKNHQDISYNDDYSVQAGIQIVKRCVARAKALADRYGLPKQGELFWGLVKLHHWIPSGPEKILRDMQGHGVKPAAWSEVKEYVTAGDNRQRLIGILKGFDPMTGINNADKTLNYAKSNQIKGRQLDTAPGSLNLGGEVSRHAGTAPASGTLRGITPTAKLPLILAGPILRRAAADKVWFWFACSKEVIRCAPSIVQYDFDKGKNGATTEPHYTEVALNRSSSDFRVVRLGENIWIVLASAVPQSGTFPTDTALGYELNISTRENGTVKTTKLADQKLDIVYPPFRRPTFVIGNLNRRLVHGSCRRPGANGNDAFGVYDELLSKNASAPLQRPASLILTGDQIYADDLAAPLAGYRVDPLRGAKKFVFPLFEAVRKLAKDAFGYVEQMPNPSGGGLTAVDNYTSGHQPGNRIPGKNSSQYAWSDRRRLTHLASSPIGFTTDDGEAHLLSFPEYAAMYLVVWNPELCFRYGVDNGSTDNLNGFPKAVGACRRVMANTATYMLFDDHDITDDWNLDQQWVDNTKGNPPTTKGNPLARRIIANGLAAYWGFQGWGNDPDMFDKNFIQVLSLYFEQLRTSKGLPRNNAAGQYEELLLTRHWSFMAASNPKALCVDTRTSRSFSTDGHAILSGEKVQRYLKKLLTDHELPERDTDTLLLVTPTPFLPHEAMMMGQAEKYPFPKKRYEGDYELYANYPPQQAELMVWLHKEFNPSAVVIFSGDVHHGSVVSGRFAHGKNQAKIRFGQAEWVIRIVQVTSSPIKNRYDSKFIDPAWDGTVEGVGGVKVNVRSIIDGLDPVIGKVTRVDAGTIGKIVAPRNCALAFNDSGSRLLQSKVLDLNGGLSAGNYIFENHLCVVDMPSRPKGEVKVLFIGQKDGKMEIARTSVDTDNDPTKLKYTINSNPSIGSLAKSGVDPVIRQGLKVAGILRCDDLGPVMEPPKD